MNPGPELDQKVAEALGWEYAGYCLRGPMYYMTTESIIAETIEVGVKFRPSTDWNDAMLAAEKAGLFADHHALSRSDGRWNIMPMDELYGHIRHPDGTQSSSECDGCGVWYRPIVTAPTGPHAICLAILKLLEKK